MSGDRPGPALLDQRFGELTERDRGVDSAGSAALAEEVARLRERLHSTEADLAERLRQIERERGHLREVTAEIDRLTAIVAEYRAARTTLDFVASRARRALKASNAGAHAPALRAIAEYAEAALAEPTS